MGKWRRRRCRRRFQGEWEARLAACLMRLMHGRLRLVFSISGTRGLQLRDMFFDVLGVHAEQVEEAHLVTSRVGAGAAKGFFREIFKQFVIRGSENTEQFEHLRNLAFFVTKY